MFQSVFDYKPAEQDYRIWLVLNPGTWLIPILLSVLLIALLVHAVLFTSSPYSAFLGTEAAPVVEVAPVAVAPVAVAPVVVAPVAAPAP